MGSRLLSRWPYRMPTADIDLVHTAFAGDARQAATPVG